MASKLGFSTFLSLLFGIILIILGVLNIWLVHPVPGIVYFLISIIYLMPAKNIAKSSTKLLILNIVKITIAVILFFFTLGVSDLGEILGF